MNKEKDMQQQIKQLQKENKILLKQIGALNKKLVESEAFKSHFLSNVTNEIINPFASVMGLSQQIMELEKEETEKAVEIAALIYSEAASLDFQLRNIFVAARLEAGEEKPELMEIDLPGLVNGLADKIKHEADQKQITFRIKYEEGTDSFVSDREKLSLILINLLSNAVNFSPPGKVVDISVARNNGNLVLKVKDQGIGMTKEEISRIFDRFHRANPMIQSLSPGSGLGLAVVEGLLFILNGKIEVYSVPDKGTTVRIFIPEENPEKIELDDDLFFDDENEESF
ncbi:MAG: hypothetical protein IEMM0006_1857 [bacterium]|nr:MAG: hypothetical protein IEMM0006_1857 [bacterium]